MANEEFISYHVEGDKELLRYLDHVEDRSRRWLKEVLGGMANYALYWARLYTPIHAGYILRHLDASPVKFRAGGAGGGGWYEVFVGVKAGDSKHPFYVHQGTGVYAGRGMIKAKGPKRMAFTAKSGRFIVTKRVKGQQAQPFIYMAYQQTQLYANARVAVFGREVLHGI